MIIVHQESGWWFRGKAPGQIRALKQASAKTEACSFLKASQAGCRTSAHARRKFQPTYFLHPPTAHKSRGLECHSAADKRPAARDGGCCGSARSYAPPQPEAA